VRGILLRPEQRRLLELEERRLPPEVLGNVLPEGVVHSVATREDALAVALEPPVTRAVKEVARRNPELYGEILAPTIGAAVKRAVADMLAAMLERFNAALERSFSMRSVRWRIEARQTGRPFAEVVLLHTLRYRVDEVFLIHTPSSLVLLDVTDASLPARAPDQIAGMLSAIDAFARDAFGGLAPEEHLRRYELGELTIYVAREADLTVAAVVRGTPSAEIGERVNVALNEARVLCDVEMRDFSGDTTGFERARSVLEPLLRTELKPAPRIGQFILPVIALLVVLGLGALVAHQVREHHRLLAQHDAYVAALAAEPGIVVTGAVWEGRTGRIWGLRDPFAATPQDVVARAGFAPTATLSFAPFISLDPKMVENRVRRKIDAPPSVSVNIDGGTLRLAGLATQEWIDRAAGFAPALPGVQAVDTSALRSFQHAGLLCESGCGAYP
jgi:OOP family OmpA-OmpF porin